MQNGQTTFNQTRMASEGGLSTILSEFKAAGDQVILLSISYWLFTYYIV